MTAFYSCGFGCNRRVCIIRIWCALFEINYRVDDVREIALTLLKSLNLMFLAHSGSQNTFLWPLFQFPLGRWSFLSLFPSQFEGSLFLVLDRGCEKFPLHARGI